MVEQEKQLVREALDAFWALYSVVAPNDLVSFMQHECWLALVRRMQALDPLVAQPVVIGDRFLPDAD